MFGEKEIRAYLEKQIDRREFIKRLRAIGVSAGAAVAYAQVLGTAGCQTLLNRTQSGPVALTQQEFQALEAIAARIVPTTDTPGALEAGAAYYIDLALAGC
jgi:hypothetical protein